MSQTPAETLESAARMAMAPPREESGSRSGSHSRWAFVYALYAAFLAALLVGAAAVASG
jgi:hypothetical protein